MTKPTFKCEQLKFVDDTTLSLVNGEDAHRLLVFPINHKTDENGKHLKIAVSTARNIAHLKRELGVDSITTVEVSSEDLRNALNFYYPLEEIELNIEIIPDPVKSETNELG
jgi:acyl carrier protein